MTTSTRLSENAASDAAAPRQPLPRWSVMTPAVTPLLPDDSPDLTSLERLLDFGLSAGVNGFLVLGSSGESVALGADDRYEVATHAVAHCRGRTHVMLGVVTHGTKDARADARRLDALRPDSLLVAAPAGLGMSPRELAGHFRAIAEAVDTPVVAYDVPTRVGVALPADLVAELAAEGTIIGLKDSSGDLVRGRAAAEATREVAGFLRFTGCEQVIDGALLGGYDGSIAGLANVFPQFHVALLGRIAAGDWAGASAVQGLIMRLLDLYFHPLEYASFTAQFFAVVKEALVQLGVIAHNRASAPLMQADESVRAHVTEMLALGRELEGQLPQPAPAGVAGT